MRYKQEQKPYISKQKRDKPSPAPRPASPDSYYQGIHPYTSRTYSPVTYSPVTYADIGPPNRDYEYVGMPLTPPPLPQNYELDEDDDSGPTTAEIIANQSQDYIDEKLAEYQATIYQLQGKSQFIRLVLLKSFG
ncbi:hypothetical protein GWI33_012696 [Rhynchophorus ferrugineus]|uniref:Uncharacterized protein n=1 Tax=Rhynchophorus ferrugineus TaxID=354439 RepID=A0A834MAP6_RHYFE|nr:hypothetical protein GWI33_012696 [Rhynchophorus ferrugineus]